MLDFALQPTPKEPNKTDLFQFQQNNIFRTLSASSNKLLNCSPAAAAERSAAAMASRRCWAPQGRGARSSARAARRTKSPNWSTWKSLKRKGLCNLYKKKSSLKIKQKKLGENLMEQREVCIIDSSMKNLEERLLIKAKPTQDMTLKECYQLCLGILMRDPLHFMRCHDQAIVICMLCQQQQRLKRFLQQKRLKPKIIKV